MIIQPHGTQWERTKKKCTNSSLILLEMMHPLQMLKPQFLTKLPMILLWLIMQQSVNYLTLMTWVKTELNKFLDFFVINFQVPIQVLSFLMVV